MKRETDMRLFKTCARAGLLVIILAAGALSPALAAAPAKTALIPDPVANPVLANMIKLGAKLYYLGTRSGLDGWFIVKDGRMQIAYSTTDKKTVVIGAMFGENGESISSSQVKTLADTNPDVTALLSGAAKEQEAINQAGSNATSASSAAAQTPATPMPGVLLSPGERLMQELSAAAGVTIGGGAPSSGSMPTLFMVMDPNCPHCQATWRALRDSVFKKALQIRMIPIGTEGTDNERAAARLLHVADPLNAWDKYVGGDKTQLAGTPDQPLITAVRANHVLVDNWNIRATPYLVYRAKDGQIKIVQGEPDKIAAVLTDLGL